ncbi:MAG: FtsX-like permease family protein, partial [Gemmatimonadales bacterium]
EAFVANNIREVAAGFRPMQLLVSGLGIVTAAALVALLVQAGVEDRRQDISVLLAMGAAAANIGVGIVRQVILLVTLGGGVGALLTLALHSVLRRWVPAVELVPQVQDLALALPLFIASSVVAASLPVLRLRRVDPIEAFRP